MAENQITLSTFDLQRLEPLLTRAVSAAELPDHLADLSSKLNECEETNPGAVPPDVVTMNSQVRLKDLDAGRELVCTLVFPRQAEVSEGRISVFAPLGAALFGARVGTTVEVSSRQGVRRFHIVELLYQPEAAGHYDL